MAAHTFDALTPASEAHRSRIRTLVIAALVAFGIAGMAAVDVAVPDRRILEVSTGASGGAAQPPAAEAAVHSWLTQHATELFPGAPASTAVGTCGAADGGGLCSAMTEDLGAAQVHLVGVDATDAGADVLVEQTASGWEVTAVAAWPTLGERYDGPPWSPTTAITAWWLTDERAATMYGEGATHLRTCDDAAPGTTQPLLCSTLVEDAGTTRTYDTGLAGRPADVRVTVTEQADGTWAITDALAR